VDARAVSPILVHCSCQLGIIGGVPASDIPRFKNRYKQKSLHGTGDHMRFISFDTFSGVDCVAAGSSHISPNLSPKGGEYIGFLYVVVEAEATQCTQKENPCN